VEQVVIPVKIVVFIPTIATLELVDTVGVVLKPPCVCREILILSAEKTEQLVNYAPSENIVYQILVFDY
jgi:hypothetical protein